MLLPVKCFTCGKEISSYYRAYEREVRQKKMAAAGINGVVNDVVYLTKVQTAKTAEGEVLDNLLIKKMCCRRHILTHVEIE
jgi:DNA-directed RNA polymerase subunit N (RpoN/RPB10)